SKWIQCFITCFFIRFPCIRGLGQKGYSELRGDISRRRLGGFTHPRLLDDPCKSLFLPFPKSVLFERVQGSADNRCVLTSGLRAVVSEEPAGDASPSPLRRNNNNKNQKRKFP